MTSQKTWLAGSTASRLDRARFDAAEAELRAAGAEPVVPHRGAVGRTMRRDLTTMLIACDQIVTVPGWQASPSARLQVHVGEAVGIPVGSLAQWRLIHTPAAEVA